MRFTKMHGAGNDFLIFDPGEVEGADLPALARRSCDRHFGVGADGILVPTSSPHADLEMVYLNSDGSPPIENEPLFPHRTNVEFVHVRNDHEIRMRIWERGAGETLASGSGSCAAAVAALHKNLVGSPVTVHLDGGTVRIDWAGGTEPVYMTGPPEYVCEGELAFSLQQSALG